MPDFNTKGAQMHFRRLLHTVGILSSVAHGANINDVAYGCDKNSTANSWVAGFDLEKAARNEKSSSGENLSTGGILSVNLQKTGSAAASATRAYICCHYDCCLELKDSGAHVWS